MMRKHLLIMGFLLVTTVLTFAQNGKLSGYVTDDTKQPVPFATIKVTSGGQLKGGGQADFNGHYMVSPLTPGSYDVEISCVGFKTKNIRAVTVNFEKTTSLNISLLGTANIMDEVEVVYKKPLVDKDQTSGGTTLTAEDIKVMPTRSIGALLTTTSGVFSSDDGGGLSIRGNREGDNIVFINGVRQFGGSLPPVEAIEELSVITSGVPAQYGDALGGVISVTTKGAAEKFNGSVFYETSRPFDKWNQEVGGFTLTGPLIRRKAKVDSNGVSSGKDKTLLGFFTTVQYNHNREINPSAVGYWKVKDDKLAEMKANPLYVPASVGSFRSIADNFTINDFENVKYRPNSARGQLQFNSNLDFQLSDNTLFTLGGNFNYGHGRNNQGGAGNFFNVFNYENNGQRLIYDYNVYGRFRQTFKHFGADAASALVKNIFYQVQFDYSNVTQISQDPKFKDRVFEYNYFGKFQDRTASFATDNSSQWIDASFLGDKYTLYKEFSEDDVERTITLEPGKYFIKGSALTQGFPGGIDFTPLAGSVGANYNTSILNSSFFKGSEAGGDLYNLNQLRSFGGAVNGEGVYTGPGYGNFSAPGVAQSGYGKNNQEQYRASLQAGFDIKDHAIKLGAEFEQRVVSNYGSGGQLWIAGRNLVNSHLQKDMLSGTNLIEHTLPDGSILLDDKRPYTLGSDGTIVGQTDFDRNLRAKLGITDPSVLINIDGLDPSLLSANLFSVKDVYFNNQPFIAYQGYDIHGNRKRGSKGNAAFYEFFTDTLNRPIDSFRPNYIAGYIEDKFEIKDLIVRLGVRVDRFDINQPVLKDMYSMTNLKLAGETDFSRFGGNYIKPSVVGDDWAVYVDKESSTYDRNNQDQFKVVGYRKGSVFYNANGAEDNSVQNAVLANAAFPFFDVSNLDATAKRMHRQSGITLDAFKDFKPQINVMPRIAFSFPVSEQTNFFAHYDVLTQRPQSIIGSGTPFDNYGSPLQYYQLGTIRSGNLFLNNPDLQPQKKIDYQIGFDQSLGSSSAIRLTASYSEIKDLIQVINIRGAYPATQFRTNGNQDFTTVKGLGIEYNLRRTENFQASASYNLQFAETSASDFAGPLLQTSTPTLRNVVPYNNDQRHAIKLNMDYRIKKGDGTGSAVAKAFEGVGFNATFFTGSGLPYTQNGAPWGGKTQIKGGINAGRLPWNNRTSVRIDKTFEFKKEGRNSNLLNVYIYVQNVFNAKNVLEVYDRTGSATDDGYLTSDFGVQQVSLQRPSPESFAMYYNMLLQNPDYFNLPRRIRVGFSFSF